MCVYVDSSAYDAVRERARNAADAAVDLVEEVGRRLPPSDVNQKMNDDDDDDAKTSGCLCPNAPGPIY